MQSTHGARLRRQKEGPIFQGGRGWGPTDDASQPQAGRGSRLHFPADGTEGPLTSGHEGEEAASLPAPAHSGRGQGLGKGMESLEKSLGHKAERKAQRNINNGAEPTAPWKLLHRVNTLGDKGSRSFSSSPRQAGRSSAGRHKGRTTGAQ